MHKAAPGIQILAWIGVPVQLTTSEGEVIPNRLENGAIRATIAEFARQMVEEIGFDGIHLNAEFITAGNQAFIDTLQVIREVLPDKAILSTTAHALPPTTRITIAPIGLDRENQSTQYLQQIARNSDQVALMAYDSGLFFPSDYRAWVTHQVKTASEEIEGIDTQFLIGLPTSEEFTASHRTNTENLSNAIYGLQQGLADNPFYANIDGIAIYPYWETDEHEWTLIDSIN
ncbi:MAG: glycoside hydrolase family 18 protein [Anaerolineae bacterium]